MTAALILSRARDALERGQSYARLSETQTHVLVPGDDREAPPHEVVTVDAAALYLLRARAEIDRALRALGRAP
jgi:hypothetical protein